MGLVNAPAFQRKATDCARCCIATVLGIPYSKVPDFYKRHRLEHTLIEGVRKWLEKHGLTLIRIPANSKPNCLYLATGMAARGFNHMVVMYGGKLVHDPHESGTGVPRVNRAYVILPMDIGVWERL